MAEATAPQPQPAEAGADIAAPPAGPPVVGSPSTVAASVVRSALGLTAHQLSEFTAGLDLDVGPRPNYPRYGMAAAHLMVAARALRDVRLPLEPALRTASTYRSTILNAEGWLVCAPTVRGWVSSLVLSADDLTTWIAAAGGRGLVLDLRSLSDLAADEWRRMLAVAVPRD